MAVPHKGELSAPTSALNDPNGTEIIRGWVANNGLEISLLPGAWDDPAAWGIALADVIRHLADAYSQTQGRSREDTVARITSLIHAELDAPTDQPSGGFVS